MEADVCGPVSPLGVKLSEQTLGNLHDLESFIHQISVYILKTRVRWNEPALVGWG
jgi:hypothetical protein